MYKDYLYGAYGSNLNMDQMSFRCPNAEPLGSLILKGWSLQFRSVADMQLTKDGKCPIGLWRITEDCEKQLDIYEGYPHLYTKQVIYVQGCKQKFGTDRVMLYLMNDQSYKAPPTNRYLQSIVDGYHDFGIDTAPIKYAVKESYLSEPRFTLR